MLNSLRWGVSYSMYTQWQCFLLLGLWCTFGREVSICAQTCLLCVCSMAEREQQVRAICAAGGFFFTGQLCSHCRTQSLRSFKVISLITKKSRSSWSSSTTDRKLHNDQFWGFAILSLDVLYSTLVRQGQCNDTGRKMVIGPNKQFKLIVDATQLKMVSKWSMILQNLKWTDIIMQLRIIGRNDAQTSK